MPSTQETLDSLKRFVLESPTSFHAAAESARRLSEGGFVQLTEDAEWPAAPGKYLMIRGGAVIAWIIPEGANALTGFNILGAHTDSPSFKLKPKPTTGTMGWLQAGVEVYGGAILNSWLDRDLCLAGRLSLRGGESTLVATGPLLRFPQLAIHLDRSVNDGLTLDKQQHMNPIWGLGSPENADILALLADAAGVKAADVTGYDLMLADTQEPERFGGKGEFFASGRLDNLSSVHSGVAAMLQSQPVNTIPVLAAFDHEEVGSASTTGASGPILATVLERISTALGATGQDFHRALAASWCLSADAAHAVHPNYSNRHDPVNRPTVNAGPVVKINANQRYATDGAGVSLVHELGAAAGVPVQDFVSNNSMPCGSTIGPLTATRVGIRTVDIGIPLLSMHSAREMCGAEDPGFLTTLSTEFFNQ